MKKRVSLYLSLVIMISSFLTVSFIALAETTDSSQSTQQTLYNDSESVVNKINEDALSVSTQKEKEVVSSNSQEQATSTSEKIDRRQQSNSTTNQPRGPSSRKAVANIVDSISLTDSAGNPLTEVTQYTEIRVNIAFSLPNNEVSNGDTSTITLPSEFMLESNITFNVTNASGDIIAVANTNTSNNAVTLTYTSFVEEHSNISGKLHFISKIDTSTVENKTDVPIYIDVEGEQIFAGDIHFENQGDDENEKFSKFSWFTNAEGTEIYNELRVNPSGNTYSDVTIEDILKTDGLSYMKDTFSIKVGNWELNSNHIWIFEEEENVTDQYTIEFSEKGFSIHLGDIGNKEYQISYKTKSDHEPIEGEKFTNYARMTDNQVVINDVEVTRTYQSGSGEADGYNYTIEIHKTNETNERLAGAVFEITRDRTGVVVGTIETDENGHGLIHQLLKDSYTLKETKAPPGYVLSSDEIKISPDDFGSDRSVLKTIINKKETPTINVSGVKKWEDNNNQAGKRPETITVNLLADGLQVDSKKVSEADNWCYEFKELPKFNKDREIIYTVTEDSVAHYTTQIKGFDITNTYQDGKTSRTVTKHWEDNNDQTHLRPENIMIQLYANGQKQGEPVQLSEKMNWTFTWDNLDLNDPFGNPIQYTIKEVAIPAGYTASIAGEKTGNLLITNTLKKKAEKNNSEKTQDTTTSFTSYGLPRTGEEKGWWLTIVGGLLVASIGGGLYLRKKAKE